MAKAKRPRAVKHRTLPPDLLSRCAMVRVIQRNLADKVVHLKRGSHDYRARQALQVLIGQRARGLAAVYKLDPNAFQALCAELKLKMEVAS